MLWDSGTDHELLGYRDVLQRHFDPSLPVVDVGCGHSAFSRALTAFSPQILGVDVSATRWPAPAMNRPALRVSATWCVT